jgi:hypothetical protein
MTQRGEGRRLLVVEAGSIPTSSRARVESPGDLGGRGARDAYADPDRRVDRPTGPVLRGLILGAVLFSVLVAPVQELAPAIARRNGDGAHLLGFALTALAAGGLIGGWYAPGSTSAG